MKVGYFGSEPHIGDLKQISSKMSQLFKGQTMQSPQKNPSQFCKQHPTTRMM